MRTNMKRWTVQSQNQQRISFLLLVNEKKQKKKQTHWEKYAESANYRPSFGWKHNSLLKSVKEIIWARCKIITFWVTAQRLLWAPDNHRVLSFIHIFCLLILFFFNFCTKLCNGWSYFIFRYRRPLPTPPRKGLLLLPKWQRRRKNRARVSEARSHLLFWRCDFWRGDDRLNILWLQMFAYNAGALGRHSA